MHFLNISEDTESIKIQTKSQFYVESGKSLSCCSLKERLQLFPPGSHICQMLSKCSGTAHATLLILYLEEGPLNTAARDLFLIWVNPQTLPPVSDQSVFSPNILLGFYGQPKQTWQCVRCFLPCGQIVHS